MASPAASTPVGWPGDGGVDSPCIEAQEQLGRLIDASAELRRTMARLEAQRLMSVHEAVEFAVRRARAFVSPRLGGDGEREMARRAVIAELAVAWRVSEYTMQRLASEAYTLCTVLPATLAAMRAGDLGGAHARVIAEAVAGVDADGAAGADPDVLSSADTELAALARDLTPAKLRHAAKRVLERLQVDTVAERHARAYADRAVQLEPARDGMAWLTIHMRASDALLIRDRLHGAVRTAKSDETESRTCAQIEADLARDLLLHATPADDTTAVAFASIRPSVHVTVPVLTLLGLDQAPADLDGYGPIDAETARRLAVGAPSFTRLLTHPISGAVLDVDRDSYRVPADLRKWLVVRDRTCRFPGCPRRAVRCEVDHSADWAAEQGVTAHDNLAHLCSAHHHLKHETSWSLKHLEDGVLEWTSLTGAVYRTTPEGDLRAGAVRQDDDSPGRIDRPEDFVAASCSVGSGRQDQQDRHDVDDERQSVARWSRRRDPATYPAEVMF